MFNQKRERMKKPLYLLASAAIAAVGFFSSVSQKAVAQIAGDKNDGLQQEQALILEQSANPDGLLAAHWSHSSHGSHGSHASHASHFSGR